MKKIAKDETSNKISNKGKKGRRKKEIFRHMLGSIRIIYGLTKNIK